MDSQANECDSDSARIPLLDKSRTVGSTTTTSEVFIADNTHRSLNFRTTSKFIEVTFKAMQARKTQRQRSGIYEGDKPWKTLWAFLILLLVFGFFAPKFYNGKFEFDFHLNVRDIGFFSLAALLLGGLLLYTMTRAIVVVRWALYWLLLAEVLLYLLEREYNIFSEKTPWILQVSLVAAEFLTFAIYALIHYFYPWFINSHTFSNVIGARKWWHTKNIGPWTYTYKSGVVCLERHTCSYRGAVNAKGLPHGYGHWMDDHYHGEILTGWWQDGLPVGPFRSREYGSGFAFSKWMVGFVQAHDDPFYTTGLYPSHNKPPRIGVSSVECSISGSFFSHLPQAHPVYGPFRLFSSASVEADTRPDALRVSTVSECLSKIRHLSVQHPLSNVEITTNASSGVSVVGHVLRGSGQTSSKDCSQIVIDVKRPTASEDTQTRFLDALDRSISFESQAHPFNASPATPVSLRSSLYLPQFHEADAETAGAPTEESPRPLLNLNGNYGTLEGGGAHEELQAFDHSSAGGPIKGGFDKSKGHFQPYDEAMLRSAPHLRVRGWESSLDGYTEALIFFPGFNAHLSTSLKRLGQFMAMGHFPAYIKPVVFSGIGGKIITYLSAIRSAACNHAQQALLDLLQGLREAGVKNVHFLTHSMGVQSLMAAFADRGDSDGEGCRSPVSQLFYSVIDGEGPDNQTSGGGTKLCARTITLMNADYPLAAFVQKGFRTLRRVCDTITVLGNRKDAALLWSSLGNGTMYLYDHYKKTQSQPDHLRVDPPTPLRHPGCNRNLDACITCCCDTERLTQDEIQGYDRLWSRQLTVGRAIFNLFSPRPELQQGEGGRGRRTKLETRQREQRWQRQWLDLDVLDTTSMEQNVHLIRHNYFNLNPVCCEDLRELIITGRRAAHRSLLLHREGNIYSYCQAPLCVVNS